jgi:hypothetical protein
VAPSEPAGPSGPGQIYWNILKIIQKSSLIWV